MCEYEKDLLLLPQVEVIYLNKTRLPKIAGTFKTDNIMLDDRIVAVTRHPGKSLRYSPIHVRYAPTKSTVPRRQVKVCNAAVVAIRPQRDALTFLV